MMELLYENWWLVVAALIIGLVVAWFVLSGSRRTTVIDRDEEAYQPGKAQRNQALIDAPPAAGPVSAAANLDRTAAAPASADAEAGATVAPAHPGQSEPVKSEPAAGRAEPEPSAPTIAGHGPDGPAVAAEAARTEVDNSDTGSDDLTRIKGIGPRIVVKLKGIDVTRFEQIANWNAQDVERIDDELNFKGRIARDQWIEQARMLSAGDTAGYEERFGKL